MSRQKLMDRVYLTCIPSEKFKTSFLSAQIAAPLEKETAGCNALMVNVLSRGTVRCPDMASIGRELDLLYGARLEPTVRKKGENQLFGFVASCIDDRFLPKGEKLLEKLTDLLGEFFCMPVTRGGRLLEAYVESERENLADMIRSDINDKRSYAARRLRESSGLSLSDLLAVDTHGFGLDLDRLETLDDVFDVVLRSIEDHGHLLGLQVGLHVLHALAERRHVVHDLLHAVVAVDVGAEHHGRRRFLRALLLLRGAYARAHQGDQAQQNNLFHCNRF